MVDINAVREAYLNKIISNVALIKTQYNIADSLTKIGSNQALIRLLMTHRIEHPIEQYVIERKKNE